MPYVLKADIIHVVVNKMMLDEAQYRWLGGVRKEKISEDVKYFKAWNAAGFTYHKYDLDINDETPHECVPNALFKMYGNRENKGFLASISDGGLEYVRNKLDGYVMHDQLLKDDLDFGVDEHDQKPGYTSEQILKFCNEHKLRCYGYDWKMQQFITNKHSDLKFNKPELVVTIDRERAKTLGISVMDIAHTLQLSFSGTRMSYFIINGKQYQVIGQFDRANRDEPLDLKSIYIRNKTGQMVQMDNVVKVTEQVDPPQLYHFNRYESATVSAGLAPGKTIGDGIAAMNRIAAKVLDASFTTSLAGAARDFAESSSNIVFAFVLALLLIYLVLAAQFESFIDPFIIMLTVPLALAGALISLWYFNLTLNIFSEIGIIVLIGLVTKNGILIVEFANQRREHGLSIREAVLDASASRLRPILMTSLATALGALPIALALGSGSTSRISLGIVVIGGLMFSLILTLFVIPAMYTFMSRKGKVA